MDEEEELEEELVEDEAAEGGEMESEIIEEVQGEGHLGHYIALPPLTRNNAPSANLVQYFSYTLEAHCCVFVDSDRALCLHAAPAISDLRPNTLPTSPLRHHPPQRTG